MDGVAVGSEFRCQSLLVDVLRETGTKLVMYLLHAANDAIGGLDQFLAFGLRNDMNGFSVFCLHGLFIH